jgi:ABC-type amino acid transport substrate-binding protein
VVAIIWMGTSFFILADFIASVGTAYLAEGPVRSLSDVRNLPVAAITGSTAADYLRGKPVQLVELDTYEELFSTLEAQEVAAAVIDYPTARYEANRQSKFRIAGDRLNREDYGIAIREGQEVFPEKINRNLLALQQSGMFETLDARWFSMEQ